jgi:hypothetical protein
MRFDHEISIKKDLKLTDAEKTQTFERFVRGRSRQDLTETCLGHLRPSLNHPRSWFSLTILFDPRWLQENCETKSEMCPAIKLVTYRWPSLFGPTLNSWDTKEFGLQTPPTESRIALKNIGPWDISHRSSQKSPQLVNDLDNKRDVANFGY